MTSTEPMITLGTIAAAAGVPLPPEQAAVAIAAVEYDSRAVRPGALFVAIRGFHADGHRFLPAAVAAGAAAVVVEREQPAARISASSRCTSAAGLGVPVLAVPDTRVALSAAAAAFYREPGRSLRVIGVTGTDGKTTTTYLISAILDAAGHRTGLFGTVAYKVGPEWRENDSRQTTPEAVEVQRLLAEMRAAGCSHAVLESSSHGLALHKLDHCAYDTAVVTYVGADHLDFHGTAEAYLEAKGRLFELLERTAAKPGRRTAIVNADDPRSAVHMRGRTAAPIVSYAIDAAADLRAEAVVLDANGASFTAVSPEDTRPVRIHLPGRFNVSNALAAIAAARAEGVPLATAAAALDRVHGVPGRMERVDEGQPFTVVVDYAHTGPAFAKVLTELRPLTSGRIIAVFGCAGEQSRERRTDMGEVAARLADFSVLTNEDPRREPPEAVIAQIAAAMVAAGAREGERFARVVDRREAIAAAFALARPGDVVLLTGKGHEGSILIGDGRLPWNEREVARAELRRLGHGRVG
jgi:UDP-N-acetylmuramoyl-L-alanyl-D-glutamate--2,6-diaminopimelate ligase